jgi:Protein of unknown function (DUF3303)
LLQSALQIAVQSLATNFHGIELWTYQGRELAMQYMIIEHFRNCDPLPVYRRFRDRGRMAPEGLQCLSSWVDIKFERCFQLVETTDRALLDRWIANWSDIVAFEVFPVVASAQAAQTIAPRL